MLRFCFLLLLSLLVSCTSHQSIVNNVDEREANEIVVFLASKGISAQKVSAPSAGVGAATTVELYSISVAQNQTTEAMALLNRYGLPRKQGTNLLTLFAKSGLMSSEREEAIRYQAGLAEELKNTIRKIDGVLDADVQISFPPTDLTLQPNATKPKITASVYVKHQGIMEDPNSHLEIKIKRLVSASVNGLNFEDVSVISDRSRFADITLQTDSEMIGAKTLQQAHVNIWGVILTKSSLGQFRFLFFTFIILILTLIGLVGFLIYKFYPLMKMQKKETENQTNLPGL
jgi:type III secretion protein J